MAGFLVACATTSGIDWNQRLGKYSYINALAELGKPENTSVRPDGTRDAEWLLRRGARGSAGYGEGGVFATPGYLEPPYNREIPPIPSQYLRLSFSTNGMLTSWAKVARPVQ